MSNKRYDTTSENEARRTFRPRDNKASLTEYEMERRAQYKNMERLRAERLAREAAKEAVGSKDH